MNLPPDTTAGAGVAVAEPGWPSSPYRALGYFSFGDAPLLAERRRDVATCASLVRSSETRLLLLHGFTGSGKSSFLRAGLCPRIAQSRTATLLPGRIDRFAVLRCTEAPLERLRDALLFALKNKDFLDRLDDSADAADSVHRILALPPQAPPAALSNALAEALAAITPALPGSLVLMLDQTEEVFTLAGKANAAERNAFFALLQRLCTTRLSLRIVVALRTEFYGQFCDEFRLEPQLTISTVETGIKQYMLRSLSDVARLEQAILRPTLREPPPELAELSVSSGELQAPYNAYHFEYEPGLARRIAADVAAHALLSNVSPLPIMQIVCRELYERYVASERSTGRNNAVTLTARHYCMLGGVGRAIENHVRDAIRRALPAIDRCSEETVTAWKLALSSLAGEQEGGSAVSLIRSADQLLETVAEAGIPRPSSEVLERLAQDGSGMLRVVRRPAAAAGASAAHYSLAHDVAAMHLAHWRVGYDRSREEREINRRQKRRYRLLLGTLLATFVAALVFFVPVYFDRKGWVDRLITYAEQDTSSEYRLRMVLLLEAMQLSGVPLSGEGSGLVDWVWRNVLDSSRARQALERVLLRAPEPDLEIAAAGLDRSGRILALYRRTNNSGADAIEFRNENGNKSEKICNLGTLPALPERARRMVGFLEHDGRELPAVAEFVSGDNVAVHLCRDGELVRVQGHIYALLPGFLLGDSPPDRLALEIVNGAVRLQTVEVGSDRRVKRAHVAELALSGEGRDLHLVARRGPPFELVWRSSYVPVLSPCDNYASIDGTLEGSDRVVHSTVTLRRFGDLDGVQELPYSESNQRLRQQGGTGEGLAFSADCRWLVLRQIPGEGGQQTAARPLRLFGPLTPQLEANRPERSGLEGRLSGIASPDAGSSGARSQEGSREKAEGAGGAPRAGSVPAELHRMFPPSQYSADSRPLHAVQEMSGDALRLAWLLPPHRRGGRASQAGAFRRDGRPVPEGVAVLRWEALRTTSPTNAAAAETNPLLFGNARQPRFSRLFFAAGGNLLVWEANRADPDAGPPVRLWDLRFEERRVALRAMAAADLRILACRVAAGEDGDNRLNGQEALAWLGSYEATQPCDGLPGGKRGGTQ